MSKIAPSLFVLLEFILKLLIVHNNHYKKEIPNTKLNSEQKAAVLTFSKVGSITPWIVWLRDGHIEGIGGDGGEERDGVGLC